MKKTCLNKSKIEFRSKASENTHKLPSHLRFASAKVCIKKSPNNYCRGSELLLELSELISELSELGLYIFLLHYMFLIHSIFLFR